jgi:hypothetical protein
MQAVMACWERYAAMPPSWQVVGRRWQVGEKQGQVAEGSERGQFFCKFRIVIWIVSRLVASGKVDSKSVLGGEREKQFFKNERSMRECH